MKFTPIRIVLTLFMVWVLVITTTAFACSKNQLTAFAQDFLSSVRAAQPHVQKLLPAKAAVWAKVVENAEKLVLAIKNSEKERAIELIADITPTINEVVEAFWGQTQVMTILAVADIALHFLVNHIKVDPHVVNASAKLGRVMLYKSQRVWGCRYRPDYHPELKYCS